MEQAEVAQDCGLRQKREGEKARNGAYPLSKSEVNDIICFIESSVQCRVCKKKTLTVVHFSEKKVKCQACYTEYRLVE